MLAEQHGAGVLVRVRSAEAVREAIEAVLAMGGAARAAAAIGGRVRGERGAAEAAAAITRCVCARLDGAGLRPDDIAAIRRNCVVCWAAAGTVPRYERAAAATALSVASRSPGAPTR